MWSEFNRILKDNGCVVLHSMEEFTFLLGMSNFKNYKYRWYWQKDRGTGFLNAKKMPLRNIEDVLVFSPSKLGNFTYNPQMTIGQECHSRGKSVGRKQEEFSTNDNYGELKAVQTKGNLKYPKTLLSFPRDKDKLHPTQKPLALAEYIIKTYTNENDIVLDISSGVSTSGLASEIHNRYWINIEKDIKKDKSTKEYICAGYCEKAKNRINTYLREKRLHIS
nr:site-specific DNA-methyltransferase [Clostridium botulinum]